MTRFILHVGDKVTHTTLGEGVVSIVDEDYVTVKFVEEELTFRIPDAFYKGFLTSEAVEKNKDEGSTLQDSIRRIINDYEAIMATFEQVRDEEEQDYDALPEELQDEEDGEQMQEYVEAIENAIDALDEAISYLDEAIDHLDETEPEDDE